MSGILITSRLLTRGFAGSILPGGGSGQPGAVNREARLTGVKIYAIEYKYLLLIAGISANRRGGPHVWRHPHRLMDIGRVP
ncbi:MAG: hypothetical protein R3D45_03980 [Rhizobiaceae bacterium]